MSDEKPTHDKALELLVYAPVGVALYVRDMLPMMMGMFVSRGKREVQSHLPGTATESPAPPAPSPADVRRRVEEGIGMARFAAESGVGVAKGGVKGGVGVAKGVAESSFDLARGVAGSALQGFTSARGTNARPSSAASRSTAPSRATAPPAGSPSPGSPSARASRAPAAPAPPTTPSPSAAPVPPTPLATHGANASGNPAGNPTASAPPEVDTLAIPDYDELSASQVVERLEGLDRASLDAIRRYESAHRGRNTILGKIAQLN